MLGYAYNAFSRNWNFFRLAVFKILQIEIANFRFTSVLPFCQHCDRKDLHVESWPTFIKNHELAVTI